MIERKFYPSTGFIPWWKKVNPIWWFENDAEPTPPDWYMPTSRWRNWLWYLRNPLQNAGRYVFGFEDKDHWATAEAPVDVVTQWEIDGTAGWRHIKTEANGKTYNFWSYENAYLIFYFGWQPGGFFGIKLHPKGNGWF